VEGRGATTSIQEVALSAMPSSPIVTTSATIEYLLWKKKRTEKALERCNKSLASLESYLSTLNVQHVVVTELGKVMEGYDATGAVLDEKVLDLEKTLKEIDQQLEVERAKLSSPNRNNGLNQRATISVLADIEGEVEMVLIYGMWNDDGSDFCY